MAEYWLEKPAGLMLSHRHRHKPFCKPQISADDLTGSKWLFDMIFLGCKGSGYSNFGKSEKYFTYHGKYGFNPGGHSAQMGRSFPGLNKALSRPCPCFWWKSWSETLKSCRDLLYLQGYFALSAGFFFIICLHWQRDEGKLWLSIRVVQQYSWDYSLYFRIELLCPFSTMIAIGSWNCSWCLSGKWIK